MTRQYAHVVVASTIGKCAANIIAGRRQEALWRDFKVGGRGGAGGSDVAEEIVEVLGDVSHCSAGVRSQRDNCSRERETSITTSPSLPISSLLSLSLPAYQ